MITRINSEPQNSAVKDSLIINQTLPNQRKASGKQAKWKIMILLF
jgi:hypothetical protein